MRRWVVGKRACRCLQCVSPDQRLAGRLCLQHVLPVNLCTALEVVWLGGGVLF